MRFYLLLGAVAAAVLGYSIFWFYLADRYGEGIAAWAELRRAEGMTVSYDGIETSGYPFRLQTTVANPYLALPATQGALSWRAADLASLSHPWNLRHVLIAATGPHEIGLTDGNGQAHEIEAETAKAVASYEQGMNGGLKRLSVEIQDLALRHRAGATQRRAEGGAARLQLHLREGTEADALVDLALKGEDLHLSSPALVPPQAELTLVELDASVIGTFEGDIDPGTIAAWRDGGGTVEIRHARADWADVSITASGSLALDAQMRPIGALTAQIKGHEALLDALVAAGQLSAKDAGSAKTVLGLLALAGGGVLSVPVRLQDGILTLGPVQVATLSPLFPPADRSPAPASPGPRQ